MQVLGIRGVSTRCGKIFLSIVMLFSTSALANKDSGKQPKADRNTKEIMNTFIEALGAVLPLSFNKDQFSASANRKTVREKLQTLRDSAHALDEHGSSRDLGFNYVARSLESDTQKLVRWYDRGLYDEAKFTLHNLTENCITCHNSLPETVKYPRPTAFFSKIDLKDMPPLDKAHYLTMTRQFDEALSTYESLMRDSDLKPATILSLAAMTQYLKIAINVKGDFHRPQKIMNELEQRAGDNDSVRNMLSIWITDLKHYEKENPLKKITLASIKNVVNAGRMHMDYPADRQGLVHYVTANAMAARYIGTKPSQPEAAEAYYLMGVTESLLGQSFWISRQDYYLEAAIRLAPGADFSRKAYAQLEENMVTGFTGSAGTNIPDDVKQLLAELKALIAKSRKEGKGT